MKRRRSWAVFTLVLFALRLLATPERESSDWTHFVRIGAYSLTSNNGREIVASAAADGVFGIEVDNDIPGRYESFLDPTQKLAAIREVARAAHAAHNKAFVYIAGLECITAHADRSPHTFAKDHPDWLQRKLGGEPAIFTGGAAFWISPGDEDVWISPYAAEWRKIYMERVRQIAASGIDGIYVDIPYWMTHFKGWENSWASFDDATVAAFRQSTGLDARRDVKLGDFSNSNFRKWVEFRIQTITDFIGEIVRNAKSVAPTIKIIPEIYPGIEEEAVRVGADVYELYPVVDAIAHEYEFGGGDHMASSRTPLDWFKYQVGMRSFRGFAQGKATWILNYSWDGDENIEPSEAMQNLAMSEIAAGANFWDAPGHVMAGSNDRETRRRIFRWIAANLSIVYGKHQPISPVGLYFSPRSRDYFAQDFLPEFQGCAILLMQRHWEWQVVTPRTLPEFQGDTLILPEVHFLSARERDALRRLLAAGKTVVITGQDQTGFPESPRIIRLPNRPGAAYLGSLDANLERAEPQRASALFAAVHRTSDFEIQASPLVVTQIEQVNGRAQVFVANFRGLRAGKNAIPIPETKMTVTISAAKKILYYLPFMGLTQKVGSERQGRRTVFHLPPIERGGVLWFAE